MSFFDVIQMVYRDAIMAGDIKLLNGDISDWNTSVLGDQPSNDQIIAMATPEVVSKYRATEMNKPILDQLEKLDIKSIRALREGDSARITQLEEQAAQLRGKLIS